MVGNQRQNGFAVAVYLRDDGIQPMSRAMVSEWREVGIEGDRKLTELTPSQRRRDDVRGPKS